MSPVLSATPLAGLPEIGPGDDLAALIRTAAPDLDAGDVLCVAHKIVSKAEGRIVALSEVTPSPEATARAAMHGKDPRHLQVILDEAFEIVRERPRVLICRTRHGYVCANAGVDASNAGGPDTLILLPLAPDSSARRLRAALASAMGAPAPAVVITDSFGRAWRNGQVETAIGVAGLAPMDDWAGRTDSDGHALQATVIAVADEAAAAADLARTKTSREPVVMVSGLGAHVTTEDGPGAAALIRPLEEDLFA